MSDTKQVAYRLPEELLARVEAYRARWTEANPGLELSMTTAVRMLLEAGLAAAQKAVPSNASTGGGPKPRRRAR